MMTNSRSSSGRAIIVPPFCQLLIKGTLLWARYVGVMTAWSLTNAEPIKVRRHESMSGGRRLPICHERHDIRHSCYKTMRAMHVAAALYMCTVAGGLCHATCPWSYCSAPLPIQRGNFVPMRRPRGLLFNIGAAIPTASRTYELITLQRDPGEELITGFNSALEQ